MASARPRVHATQRDRDTTAVRASWWFPMTQHDRRLTVLFVVVGLFPIGMRMTIPSGLWSTRDGTSSCYDQRFPMGCIYGTTGISYRVYVVTTGISYRVLLWDHRDVL